MDVGYIKWRSGQLMDLAFGTHLNIYLNKMSKVGSDKIQF